MPGKENVFASMCILSGVVVALGVFIALEGGPNIVLSLSMIVIGLGAALVAVRYGRIGPYHGQFGPPPFEEAIRARIAQETERAVRYDRQFSILAVRQKSRRSNALASKLRGVDEVIQCRKGVTLLLLPETSSESAMRIFHRVRVAMGEPSVVALVSCPDDGLTPEEIGARLLTLLRSEPRRGDAIASGVDAERIEAVRF